VEKYFALHCTKWKNILHCIPQNGRIFHIPQHRKIFKHKYLSEFYEKNSIYLMNHDVLLYCDSLKEKQRSKVSRYCPFNVQSSMESMRAVWSTVCGEDIVLCIGTYIHKKCIYNSLESSQKENELILHK